MRALIAGCGYIGLPLGAALAGLGHEVFGLRRSLQGAAELERAGIRPLAADITKAEELAGLPAGYDWVVNCVASSGGGAAQYRALYLEGTRNLLAWLAARPPKKFVYTSSTSVYGQTDASTVDESSPAEAASETAPILLETERVLLEAAAQRGFPAVIARLAGIYGPGRAYWLKQFLNGQARLEGAGGRFLNMIHRDDVAGVLIAALERGRAGQIYNAVDDEPVAQLDCFRWLAKALSRPLPPPAPEEPGTPPKRGLTNKRVSNAKLKRELGYNFKYPTFREGFTAEIRSLAMSPVAGLTSEPG